MLNINELKKLNHPERIAALETGQQIKMGFTYRCAVIVPDIYETAMTNISMIKIYNELNNIKDIWCERVFCVDINTEEYLRKNGEKLFTIESKTPLAKLDLLIFVIDDPLQITSVLNILNLAKIATLKARRTNQNPKIVFTGLAMNNTKPFKIFAEYIIQNDIEMDVGENKNESYNKEKINLVLETIKTCNKEDLYPKYKKEYLSSSIKINVEGNIFPLSISKDTFKSKENILQELLRGYKGTGEKNISFVSFEGIEEKYFLDILYNISSKEEFKNSNIVFKNVVFNKNNLWQLKYIDTKSPKVFVGAATPILQKILNINTTKEEIKEVCRKIFQEGLMEITLQYIIGVPKENFNEISYILALAEEICKMYFEEISINPEKNIVTIELKSFTPDMDLKYINMEANTPDKLELKIRYLEDKNTNKDIEICAEDPYMSAIRWYISSGDTLAGKIIYDAWKAGAKFDNIKEHFNFENWQIAFCENKTSLKEIYENIRNK